MKKEYLNQLSKQKKQVLVLYIGTLIGLVFGVFSSIINTRFVVPQDYGDVRYVQNAISLIASLLLFGYFLSGSRLLAISNSENKSRDLRGLLIIILLCAVAVLIIGVAMCGVIHLKKDPNITRLFMVSLPVCMYPLLLNYINTVAQGDNHIGRLSFARCVPTCLYVVTAYIIYSNYGATSELMILLQWGIYSILLIGVVFSTKPTFNNVKQNWITLNKENKDYGLQLYWGSLVMVATNYIAGITLGMVNSDNTEVGFYTLALTITSPLATLPATIGTTYFKQFAHEPKIPDKVMRFTILLTAGSCLLFIALIKPIVSLMYPQSYSTVAYYAIWLAIGYSINGYGDMINRYLGSHGQGAAIRNSSFANGIFKIFGFTILVYYLNTLGALLTNIICSTIYAVTLLYYYKKFKLGNE